METTINLEVSLTARTVQSLGRGRLACPLESETGGYLALLCGDMSAGVLANHAAGISHRNTLLPCTDSVDETYEETYNDHMAASSFGKLSSWLRVRAKVSGSDPSNQNSSYQQGPAYTTFLCGSTTHASLKYAACYTDVSCCIAFSNSFLQWSLSCGRVQTCPAEGHGCAQPLHSERQQRAFAPLHGICSLLAKCLRSALTALVSQLLQPESSGLPSHLLQC